MGKKRVPKRRPDRGLFFVFSQKLTMTMKDMKGKKNMTLYGNLKPDVQNKSAIFYFEV